LCLWLAGCGAFAASEYRVPDNPDVVELLTATQTPTVLFNAASGGEPALDYMDISPDGRHLSAVSFRGKLPGLALFEIDTGRECLLPTTVTAVFEAPCSRIDIEKLRCRLIPDEQATAPAPLTLPNIMDHPGGKARTRTIGNLLENAYDAALFDHTSMR
jgi:hypothetical protein